MSTQRICVCCKYFPPLESRQYFDVDKVPHSILNCRIVKGYKQVIMMKVLLFDMKEVPRRRVWMMCVVVLEQYAADGKNGKLQTTFRIIAEAQVNSKWKWRRDNGKLFSSYESSPILAGCKKDSQFSYIISFISFGSNKSSVDILRSIVNNFIAFLQISWTRNSVELV